MKFDPFSFLKVKSTSKLASVSSFTTYFHLMYMSVFDDYAPSLSCVVLCAFTQKPTGGRLLCSERGEREVSAYIWRAAKLVLRGCEHLAI